MAASTATALATLARAAILTIAEGLPRRRRSRTGRRARSRSVTAPPARITILGKAPSDSTVSRAESAVPPCQESHISGGRMAFEGTRRERFDGGDTVVN